jgi:ElaB/YqjD/DUF883 family membrane-anchored ribosome-binding protein
MATTTSTDDKPSLTEKIAEKVGDKTEAALDQVRSAVQIAEEGLQRARAATERTQEVAGTFQTALEKSLKDQPNATLAAAAMLGFVLGAFWKATR